jgi:ankyrin repeat protein
MRDCQGFTALMHAVVANALTPAVLLCGAGADVNIPDLRGSSPLMQAVASADPLVVAELLAVPGVRLNHQDDAGATAVLYGAERGRSAEVASWLVARPDYDVNALLCFWEPLLVNCCRRGDELLLAAVLARKDVNVSDSVPQSSLHAS